MVVPPELSIFFHHPRVKQGEDGLRFYRHFSYQQYAGTDQTTSGSQSVNSSDNHRPIELMVIQRKGNLVHEMMKHWGLQDSGQIDEPIFRSCLNWFPEKILRINGDLMSDRLGMEFGSIRTTSVTNWCGRFPSFRKPSESQSAHWTWTSIRSISWEKMASPSIA